MSLSHVDATGRPTMVDVGQKAVSRRTAVAVGCIRMSNEILDEVKANVGPKGDVLTTAELAGTVGAKRTADLIPLCHTLPLDHVHVEAVIDESLPGIRIRATASATARTGVEMEALTAVSVALLTVYDMTKAAGHGMVIADIHLVEKTGGSKGDWRKTDNDPNGEFL